jgi:dCMP deaminase
MKKIIDVAKAASMLSKDSTKVGALVLSADNRVIGVGCNGYPSGYDDTDLTNKYDKVIHAEVNALINSRAVRGEVHKIVVYGLPPCKDCMKFIAAFGVKEVHFTINKDIGSHLKWHKSYIDHRDLHPQLEFIEHE